MRITVHWVVTVHAGGKTPIPSAASVLRELNHARTPKIRVWSRSLNPIDSIGWLLSITIGLNLPGEGIDCLHSTIRCQLQEVLFLLHSDWWSSIWSSGKFFFVSKVRKCVPSCRKCRSASRENMCFVADKSVWGWARKAGERQSKLSSCGAAVLAWRLTATGNPFSPRWLFHVNSLL